MRYPSRGHEKVSCCPWLSFSAGGRSSAPIPLLTCFCFSFLLSSHVSDNRYIGRDAIPYPDVRLFESLGYLGLSLSWEQSDYLFGKLSF